MLLAELQSVQSGYEARFEVRVQHAVEKVWSFLTENDKLALWFSELKVEDLREGGVIKFDMQDGTFEEMEITALKNHSILEYTWGEDLVRFELYPESGGSRLVLVEKLQRITDHTPKDLAGWHVCLEVIHALLDGRTLEDREQEWKMWYPRYTELLSNI
ncbi:SRPBCC family protein [Paenibacillus albidus]|uniref:SRPBCC family protein n=1 Tax=Paenibacillus albidus TaxID=2041023 RepID=UPI001BE9BF96|nr:SRPBCC family protein [Paenibacillus albidus]MBT2289302.1 SRPBCC family protein [Paenibacillus albidus]